MTVRDVPEDRRLTKAERKALLRGWSWTEAIYYERDALLDALASDADDALREFGRKVVWSWYERQCRWIPNSAKPRERLESLHRVQSARDADLIEVAREKLVKLPANTGRLKVLAALRTAIRGRCQQQGWRAPGKDKLDDMVRAASPPQHRKTPR